MGSGDQDDLLEEELEKLDLKNITEKRSFCAQKDIDKLLQLVESLFVCE